MGLLEKAKEAAGKASTRAEQGIQMGQARLEEMQAKRREDGLLHDLGAAYYAEQRSGGDHDAVVRLLAAVDAAKSEHAEKSAHRATTTTRTRTTGTTAPTDAESPHSWGEAWDEPLDGDEDRPGSSMG